MASAGAGFTVLRPAAPRKLPMTAISGLNTFDAAAAAAVDREAPRSALRRPRLRAEPARSLRLAAGGACAAPVAGCCGVGSVALSFASSAFKRSPYCFCSVSSLLSQLLDLLSQRLRVLRLRPEGSRRHQHCAGDDTNVCESQTPHDHSSAASPRVTATAIDD